MTFDLRIIGDVLVLFDDRMFGAAIAKHDVRDLVRDDEREPRGIVEVMPDDDDRTGFDGNRPISDACDGSVREREHSPGSRPMLSDHDPMFAVLAFRSDTGACLASKRIGVRGAC